MPKSMIDNRDNPVWDVYNEFRTARLNILYYSHQLRNLILINTTIEILIAIFTSSTIASIWFWKTDVGQCAWQIFGVISAILAILKPILKMTDTITKKSEIASAYRELDQDFLRLKIMINQEKKYDESLKKEFEILLKKKGEIVSKYKDDDGPPSTRLLNRCFGQVNNELPVENFYIPKEVNDVKQSTPKTNTNTPKTNTNTNTPKTDTNTYQRFTISK